MDAESKPTEVVLSPEAEPVFAHLEALAATRKLERSLVNAIRNKLSILKWKPDYGQSIAKDRIPLKYRQQYGVDNLHRVELPQYWRFTYTLYDEHASPTRTAFILDILTHPEYDKLFGYAKK